MKTVGKIRAKIHGEIFDYQVLLDTLSGYRKPRDKITRLLAAGAIVRIKKGLYCFGDPFRKKPISREHLANLIYGPSYISIDYALSYYGLIPERVETITSVTTHRSRDFDTPFGDFSYHILKLPRYAVGAVFEIAGNIPYLMASPEKALVDKVWTDKRFSGRRISDFDDYLCDDLRIERGDLGELDYDRLHAIAKAYDSAKINNLVRYLKRLKGNPMHEAIRNMLDRYECRTRDDYVNALREILQDISLLGLWRAKFFEHAAFYGGTALRVLHGLDRYSEDLDFSLIKPDASFSLGVYGDALQREISSFGFHVEFEGRQKTHESAIDLAFLKANTYRQLIVIEADQTLLGDLHPSKKLKIRLEVDTDPPGGFETETQYILQPIPFFVRVYCLPDLFAGKLHAILCRRWKTRVKGRDWYDLAWYSGRFPEVRIRHLEARMRQSGDYRDDDPLTADKLRRLLRQAVDNLDVEQVRREMALFIRDKRALDVWSRAFFSQTIKRIIPV